MDSQRSGARMYSRVSTVRLRCAHQNQLMLRLFEECVEDKKDSKYLRSCLPFHRLFSSRSVHHWIMDDYWLLWRGKKREINIMCTIWIQSQSCPSNSFGCKSIWSALRFNNCVRNHFVSLRTLSTFDLYSPISTVRSLLSVRQCKHISHLACCWRKLHATLMAFSFPKCWMCSRFKEQAVYGRFQRGLCRTQNWILSYRLQRNKSQHSLHSLENGNTNNSRSSSRTNKLPRCLFEVNLFHMCCALCIHRHQLVDRQFVFRAHLPIFMFGYSRACSLITLCVVWLDDTHTPGSR